MENITFSQIERKDLPLYEEVKAKGKDYVSYGKDNLFPQYIWDLYLRSAVLQSIINGTGDYVIGEKMLYNPTLEPNARSINKEGEYLDDVIKQITSDYLIFGGFAIQIMFNKLGGVAELYALDFQRIRVNEDLTKVYYSDSWGKWSSKALEYDIYDGKKRSGTSIFYFKGHITRGVYPIPKYNGALAAVETSTEISKFHLNNILNNFAASAVISFNNGVPEEDVKKKIEKDIQNKFSGSENAGRFILSFNQSKENATTIERLSSDDFDKKFEALQKSTTKDIFIAWRATPALFGLNPENNGFSKQEFLEAFELYNKTMVSPIQDDITRCFDKIYKTEKSITFVPFKLETEEANNEL